MEAPKAEQVVGYGVFHLCFERCCYKRLFCVAQRGEVCPGMSWAVFRVSLEGRGCMRAAYGCLSKRDARRGR